MDEREHAPRDGEKEKKQNRTPLHLDVPVASGVLVDHAHTHVLERRVHQQGVGAGPRLPAAVRQGRLALDADGHGQ